MGKMYKLLSFGVLWLMIDLAGVNFWSINGVEGVDLMFHLYAGREDCFFEYFERNETVYVEYNVIGTGMGDGDINFQLTDPQGRPVVTEFRKAASRHDIHNPNGGEYRICFDNTYSHFTSKQIAFTVSNTSPNDINWQGGYQDLVEEGTYGVQVNEIKERIDKVRSALNEIETIQEQYRIIELRDRSIAEHNFERVNYWSTVFLIFSVVIGGIRVFIVKGLFDPHYDVRSYVKKLTR